MTVKGAIEHILFNNVVGEACWTKSGQIRLSFLSKICDRRVTAKERDEAFREHITSAHVGRNTVPLELGCAIEDSVLKVSAAQVAQAVWRSDLRKLRVVCYDTKFTALPIGVWEEILEWSDIDQPKYVESQTDCDNFALALSGQLSLRLGVNGVGVVLDESGGHAYNCILVKRGLDQVEIEAVEPQKDTFPVIDSQPSYSADKGEILFC